MFRTLLLVALLIQAATALSQKSDYATADISDQRFHPLHYKHWEDYKQFVYWAEKGQELMQLNRYVESNECLETACQIWLDQRHTEFPIVDVYDEVHEFAIVLYFKTLNSLQMGDLSGATVECKRLNDWVLNGSFNKVTAHLIQNDPLIHTIMEIVYELNEDVDNATISAQNALKSIALNQEGFTTKYVSQSFVKEATVLKDLPRTPLANAPIVSSTPAGRLILLWNNGQAPTIEVKKQDFDIFLLRRGCNLGPMPADSVINKEIIATKYSWPNAVRSMAFINPKIPKYTYKTPVFQEAEILNNGKPINLDLVEDLSLYAEKAWHFRLNSSGRHIWKYGSNWRTMPGAVYIAIIPLSEGQNTLTVSLSGSGRERKESFTLNGDGLTYFRAINTMLVAEDLRAR